MQPLADLSALLFETKSAEFQKILDQERGIRARLADLEIQAQTADALGAETQRAYRRLGADAAWRSWSDRRRRQLQLQLAQTLSRKARALDTLRQAHGRKLATESLVEAQNRTSARLRDKRKVDAMQDLFMLQQGRRTPD